MISIHLQLEAMILIHLPIVQQMMLMLMLMILLLMIHLAVVVMTHLIIAEHKILNKQFLYFGYTILMQETFLKKVKYLMIETLLLVNHLMI